MKSVCGVRVPGRLPGILMLTLALAASLSSAASAQPFGGWLTFPGYPATGYVEIPDNAALNPTGAITIEAWVNVVVPAGTQCVSIIGKGWTESYWVGVCQSGANQTLRSYVRGYDSTPAGLTNGRTNRDAGLVPAGVWTHIAVVFDGTHRLHYINGVLAGSWAETQPLTTSTRPVQIGSDYSYSHTPAGAIDEVNLWNVARTQAQIQQDMAAPITGPVQGLLAVWSLNGNANDAVAVYEGTLHGSAAFAAPAPPAGPWLATSRIPGFQFKVRVTAGAPITGVQESDCIAETLCVSASVPGRSEVLIRVVGPKPNGYLWPNIVKFNTSQVEVWADQLGTGSIKYYVLPGAWPGLDTLPGLYDRTGFLP